MSDTWWENAQRYELAGTQRLKHRYYREVPLNWEMIVAECQRHDLDELRTHCRFSDCVEVGCNVAPLITSWEAASYLLIDPVLEHYKPQNLPKTCGLVWAEGEFILRGLAGSIEGCIVSRNCIDHADDPLELLRLMCRAAAPDCWLLEWSDIWHREGVDEGHRQISEDDAVLRDLVVAEGFDIRHEFRIREATGEGWLKDWGCLARKQ